MSDVDMETLAETENYVAWLSKEPDGENVIHLELGAVTLHFFHEEWTEVLELIDAARKGVGGAKPGGSARGTPGGPGAKRPAR